ncbi:Putative LOC100120342 [Caligus rogercresseyi]|uniref:LOC100120342 n=1 Tax=Caligus rogercresseyi TaxID=217165 RepID=A0A7T8KB11_CALRO|nr:Putative LOC100120342 [Caligus rogercresseyi]
MDAVKSFNQELSSLYEIKPPISKAKMTSITKGAIKAIKFYKHVVQSVEKFIQKCRPEYKIPGLYVIDPSSASPAISLVRRRTSLRLDSPRTST